MNRRQVLCMSIAATVAASRRSFSASLPPSDQNLSDDAIRKTLSDRIDRDHQNRGIVVGMTTPNGSRFIAHGNLDDEHSQPVTAKTSFELGSITKVFTALLLTEAVRRKEVALADPAAKYFPLGMKALERNGTSVTLEHLATHLSGLPAQLNNLARDPALARTDDMTVAEAYSARPEDLHRFLSAYELTRDPGSQFEYSHLGMTLLGHILAIRAGTDFATLLDARILRPLHMTSTGGKKAHADSVQFAVGHDAALNSVSAETGLAGSSGLRSSAEDLVHFLRVAMGIKKSPLKPAFDMLLSAPRPIGPDLEQAFGWQIRNFKDQQVVHKGGNTFGFCAFVAFDPAKRMGVVVLSNTNTEISDIGLHLLRSEYPLTKLAHTIVPTDPTRLDGYVGLYRYDPPPKTTVNILRQGDELFVELNGSPKFRLYREGDQAFFLKEFEFSVEFQTNQDGEATGFVLHQKNVPDVLFPRSSK